MAEDGTEQPARPGLRQQNPPYSNKPLRAVWLRLIRCQGASTQADKEGQIIHLAQTVAGTKQLTPLREGAAQISQKENSNCSHVSAYLRCR